jgi:ribonuclease Z
VLVSLEAGPYTVRGVSLGGVYTALQIPELGICLDVGLAPRTFASTRRLFLSHGHVDHVGALATMLGIRGLMNMKRRLQVFMPAEIVGDVTGVLERQSAMQRYDLSVDAVGMNPGDEVELRADLRVRAFRTMHPVPSLGYQFLRRTKKLRREFHSLPGHEIQARRHAGEDIFDDAEALELAYATDTLAKVLDNTPSLYASKVLVLECTFLDERKSLEASQAGCHIHLDELIERADRFANEHLVLMHFSQIYQPREVHEILAARCPPELAQRIRVFAPASGHWPG